MAKINRYSGDLKAFASDAEGSERTIFGSTDQADDLDSNITSDFLRGWGIVGVNENPTKQDFNALAFTTTKLIAYLHQMGVAEHDMTQEYHIGSVVQKDGTLYSSQTDNNAGNDPSTDDGTNWIILPNDNQMQVDSVSDLQSGSFPASLKRLWLAGYYGVGTAGGGPLYRDDESTEDDNGGTVFVDSDGVRWKRPKDDEIYISYFGPTSGGNHTQIFIDALEEADVLYVENMGFDYITDRIHLSSNKRICGIGYPVFFLRGQDWGDTSTTPAAVFVFLEETDSAVVEYVEINGNKGNHIADSLNNIECVEVDGTNNTIQHCIIHNAEADGIDSDGDLDSPYQQNNKFLYNKIYDCGGWGIHNSTGSQANIMVGNEVFDCGFGKSRGGIDSYRGNEDVQSYGRHMLASNKCYNNRKNFDIRGFNKSTVTGEISFGGELDDDFSEAIRGSIYESGSNANGYYVRWENGEQVCWRIVEHDMSTSDLSSYSFPANFVGALSITGAPEYTTGSSYLNAYKDLVFMCREGDNDWRISAQTTVDTVQEMYLFAWGFWK